MAAPASSDPEAGSPARRLAQVVILALWLGAAAFFSLVIARAAFAVLPTRELAGALVGATLPPLFIMGAVAGALALILELRSGPARFKASRLAAHGIMAVSCLVAQLVVAPRIAALRATLTVPLASLSADDPMRIAFGRLHMVSVAWLGVAMLAAGSAVALAAFTLHSRGSR